MEKSRKKVSLKFNPLGQCYTADEYDYVDFYLPHPPPQMYNPSNTGEMLHEALTSNKISLTASVPPFQTALIAVTETDKAFIGHCFRAEFSGEDVVIMPLHVYHLAIKKIQTDHMVMLKSADGKYVSFTDAFPDKNIILQSPVDTIAFLYTGRASQLGLKKAKIIPARTRNYVIKVQTDVHTYKQSCGVVDNSDISGYYGYSGSTEPGWCGAPAHVLNTLEVVGFLSGTNSAFLERDVVNYLVNLKFLERIVDTETNSTMSLVSSIMSNTLGTPKHEAHLQYSEEGGRTTTAQMRRLDKQQRADDEYQDQNDASNDLDRRAGDEQDRLENQNRMNKQTRVRWGNENATGSSNKQKRETVAVEYDNETVVVPLERRPAKPLSAPVYRVTTLVRPRPPQEYQLTMKYLETFMQRLKDWNVQTIYKFTEGPRLEKTTGKSPKRWYQPDLHTAVEAQADYSDFVDGLGSKTNNYFNNVMQGHDDFYEDVVGNKATAEITSLDVIKKYVQLSKKRKADIWEEETFMQKHEGLDDTTSENSEDHAKRQLKQDETVNIQKQLIKQQEELLRQLKLTDKAPVPVVPKEKKKAEVILKEKGPMHPKQPVTESEIEEIKEYAVVAPDATYVVPELTENEYQTVKDSVHRLIQYLITNFEGLSESPSNQKAQVDRVSKEYARMFGPIEPNPQVKEEGNFVSSYYALAKTKLNSDLSSLAVYQSRIRKQKAKEINTLKQSPYDPATLVEIDYSALHKATIQHVNHLRMVAVQVDEHAYMVTHSKVRPSEAEASEIKKVIKDINTQTQDIALKLAQYKHALVARNAHEALTDVRGFNTLLNIFNTARTEFHNVLKKADKHYQNLCGSCNLEHAVKFGRCENCLQAERKILESHKTLTQPPIPGILKLPEKADNKRQLEEIGKEPSANKRSKTTELDTSRLDAIEAQLSALLAAVSKGQNTVIFKHEGDGDLNEQGSASRGNQLQSHTGLASTKQPASVIMTQQPNLRERTPNTLTVPMSQNVLPQLEKCDPLIQPNTAVNSPPSKPSKSKLRRSAAKNATAEKLMMQQRQLDAAKALVFELQHSGSPSLQGKTSQNVVPSKNTVVTPILLPTTVKE